MSAARRPAVSYSSSFRWPSSRVSSTISLPTGCPCGRGISLTFVLSGAIGNIYDRISYGYVVDFIFVHYKGFEWPAFNVADSAITFGIGLWLCTQFFLKEGERLDRRARKQPDLTREKRVWTTGWMRTFGKKTRRSGGCVSWWISPSSTSGPSA